MDIISRIRNYLKTHSLRRIWYRVALVLSSMAVFVTTYFLMLPALTVTVDNSIIHLGSIDKTYTDVVSEQGKGVVYDSAGKLHIQVNNIYRIDAYLGSEAWCGGDHKTNIYKYLNKDSGINTVLVRLKSTKKGTSGFNGGNLGSFLFADTHNHKNNTSYGINDNRLRMKDDILYKWYLNGSVGTHIGTTGSNIDFSDWVVIRVECYKVKQERYTNSAAFYEFYAVEQVYGTVDRPNDKRDYTTADASKPDAFTRDMVAKLGLTNSTDKGFMLLVRKSFITKPENTDIYSRLKGESMYIPVAGLDGSTGSTYDAATPNKGYGYNQYQSGLENGLENGLDTLVDFNQEPFVQNVKTAPTWTKNKDSNLGIYSTPDGNNGSNGYRGPNEYGNDQHRLGFITFSPAKDQRADSNAGVQDGDIDTIDNIDFKLFNYSWSINSMWTDTTKKDNKVTEVKGVEYIRPIAPFFNFRYTDEHFYDANTNRYMPHAFYWNDYGACPCVLGNAATGTCYLARDASTGRTSYLHRAWPIEPEFEDAFKPFDSESFEVTHTTVEYNLLNGYPVLDFTRNARFEDITYTIPSKDTGLFYYPNKSVLGKTASDNYGFGDEARSLGYLFGSGDGQVTAYNPTNTILQYDKNSGMYYYDSSKNAVDYDEFANLFRLRNYVESAEYGAFSGKQTFDFLPFNYCSGIVTGTEYAKDSNGAYTLRQKHFNDCQLMRSLNKDEEKNDKITKFRYNNIDYWFGMTMEFNFAQGKDGKLSLQADENGKKPEGDGKPMIFNFAGDDDVWVFIDGVLALDLGGTHSIVNGSINFSTGEVIQSYPAGSNKTYNTTLIEYFGRAGALKFDGKTEFYDTKTENFDFDAFKKSKKVPDGWKQVTDGNGSTYFIFDDYSIHNLKFFYIERGGRVANNKIEFYMSTFANNSLLVEKQVTPKDDPDLKAIKDTQEYRFKVLRTDSEGNLLKDANGNYISVFAKDHPFITRAYEEDGTELNTQSYVGEDGIFTLKAGETAVFEKMNEIVQEGSTVAYYVVQELLPNGQVFQYDGVAVNEVSIEPNTSISGDNTVYTTSNLNTADTNHVRFTNKINKEKLHNLEIIKDLDIGEFADYGTDSGEQITADTKFKVNVTIDGKPLPSDTEYIIYELDEQGKIDTSKEEKKQKVTMQDGKSLLLIEDNQKAVIKGLLDGTVVKVQEVFDADSVGYTIDYSCTSSENFDGTCAAASDSVNGTISSNDTESATVSITIKNARRGGQAKVSVTKNLKNSAQIMGSQSFAFSIKLEQIVSNEINATLSSDTSNNKEFNFVLDGVASDSNLSKNEDYYIKIPDNVAPGETKRYYYRISEIIPADKLSFISYDDGAFVLTVAANETEEGVFSVKIESIKRYKKVDGSYELDEETNSVIEETNSVIFDNTLELYSLPTTGANLFLNTRAFSLLGTAMVVSLLVVVLVCVRKRKNGVF